MGWAPRIRIFPASSCCPISVRSRSAARSNGAPGFLPASYQGTVLRWKGDPILDLQPAGGVDAAKTVEGRWSCCAPTTRAYLEKHVTNPDLQGRIDAYELAYRMQAEVPGVLDTGRRASGNTGDVRTERRDTKSFGKRCLMARQMVEKGVRFVQLYTPSQSLGRPHRDLKNHTKNAPRTDKPIAALIKDLKRRGLLDSTLVVWMGEFGRTPDNPADLRNKRGPRSQHARDDDVVGGRRHQAGRYRRARRTNWASKRSKISIACATCMRRSCT